MRYARQNKILELIENNEIETQEKLSSMLRENGFDVTQATISRDIKEVNERFRKLQVLSSAFVAFSHGNNDAQKTMGIITLALITGGLATPESGVPFWVKITCAITMALGTSLGGWKIMKTMGGGVTRLEPSMGFVAQTASAVAIESMTWMGAPVSTTQVITTSIIEDRKSVV